MCGSEWAAPVGRLRKRARDRAPSKSKRIIHHAGGKITLHLIYLHGFGSSPGSTKARYFADRAAENGLTLEAPDLNLPDFSTLTVTRMLDQLDAVIDQHPPGPMVLLGASLGGFVALHAASRRAGLKNQARPVTRLILMAPALEFGADRRGDPVVAEWRRSGRREVFHHAYGRPIEVGFGLYDDAGRYDSSRVNIAIPILVFQGRRDGIVHPSEAVEFAGRRPNVRLRLLDDDHQLGADLPLLWRESAAFLGLDHP